jgi:hypothetical protein
MEQIKELLTKVRKLNLDQQKEIPYSIIPLLYNRITTKELLHSEILASLLRPDSEYLCSTTFLLEFLRMINIEEKMYNTAEEFKIDLEFPIEGKRRIDILIRWDDKAVIVENKLNNAYDQIDQLGDYYKAIHGKTITNETYTGLNNKRYNVLKVVYMPCNKTKAAPDDDLNVELKEKLINIYPNDLIKFLETCSKAANNEIAKQSCDNYSVLLKYINLQNLYFMNSTILQKELKLEEIKTLIDLNEIVNSSGWNMAKLSEIECRLRNKKPDIKFKEKQDRYVEIYFDNYEFWVELYCYPKHFGLWIADESSKDVLNPKITNLGFHHDVMDKGFHYFKNDKMFKYKFPTEDHYEKMIGDICSLLEHSRKNYK